MSIRRIKKALGLLLVDIVLIIGIFVLQFRTDSNIIEKIGNLQITLEKEDNQTNVTVDNPLLQNYLYLAYNGMNISIDQQHPAMIVRSGNETKEPVVLESYKKDNLSMEFVFTENVKMKVSLLDETQNSPLNIKVFLPSEIESFILPYKFSQTMRLQKEDKKHIVMDGKKNSWELSIPGVEQSEEKSDNGTNLLCFTQYELAAKYALFDNTKQITFDNISELAVSGSGEFNKTVESFKKNLITLFENNIVEATISEQAVVSYIAAKASNNEYTQAIDKIPSSFKKSPIRTYLSAPYLNNLEEMNETLEDAIAESEKQITKYKFAPSLDLFTVRNVSMNLWLYPDISTVRNLLIKSAELDISLASLDQVTGLLKTYLDLNSYKSGYAKYLEPVLEKSVKKILDSCSFERDVLTISENGTYLSVVQAVDVGITLLRYGIYANNETYIMGGRALVNSYIGDSSSFDLRTLSNIYPILAYDNKYYPHFEKIFTDNGLTTWAWTCSPSIKFISDTSHSCVLNIDFPESWTHYVILKGIPTFKTIYIYDIPFRTDPRFETYNSSGYVYKYATDTLLLKSRHKSATETVRLVFGNEEQKIDENSVESENENENENQSESQDDGNSAVDASAIETPDAVNLESYGY